MKKIVALKVISLLVVLASLGCSPGKEDMEARNFVQNYVSTLQLAYSKADLNKIAPFTTEKELKKVFPVFQALQSTENIMLSEILDFKIKKSGIKKDTATVTTNERWRYWWQDVKTGVITKPKAEESYRLEYNLVKVNGQWKVDFIKNLNE